VGDLHNNDLYGSDDDDAGNAYADQEMATNLDEKLDLGFYKTENAPKKQFNFGNKAVADINAKIQQLGFSKATSLNELAARGV